MTPPVPRSQAAVRRRLSAIDAAGAVAHEGRRGHHAVAGEDRHRGVVLERRRPRRPALAHHEGRGGVRVGGAEVGADDRDRERARRRPPGARVDDVRSALVRRRTSRRRSRDSAITAARRSRRRGWRIPTRQGPPRSDDVAARRRRGSARAPRLLEHRRGALDRPALDQPGRVEPARGAARRRRTRRRSPRAAPRSDRAPRARAGAPPPSQLAAVEAARSRCRGSYVLNVASTKRSQAKTPSSARPARRRGRRRGPACPSRARRAQPPRAARIAARSDSIQLSLV